jgi:hypothetical protein
MKAVSGLQFWSHRFRGLGPMMRLFGVGKLVNSAQETRIFVARSG